MLESVFVWGFSALMTVVGAGMLVHYGVIASRWPVVRGRVVGNIADDRGSEDGSAAYFPEIAFTTADGREYRVRGDIGRRREWVLGTEITLRHRPDRPDHATTLKGWQRVAFPLVFLGFGLVGLAAAAGWVR